jgi:Zn-finger nucleic acid-binding protein
MTYFIRRGTVVKGPFSQAKLKSLVQKSKIKKSDTISVSPDGPWEPITTAHSRTSQRTRAPRLPTVKDCVVTLGLLGKYKIDFACPQCSIDLTSGEDDIGDQDHCPTCGIYFILSSSIAGEVAADREQRAIEKKAAGDEKQRKREEKQRQRKREADERMAASQMDPELWDGGPSSRGNDIPAGGATTMKSNESLTGTSTFTSCWYCGGEHFHGVQCSFCSMIQ